MKKFTAILTAFLIIALSVCTAYAADELCEINISADATDLKTGGTFVLHISLDNVTAKAGLSLVEMNLIYDESLFSVEKVESHYPESWKDHKDFEDWTQPLISEETGEKYYKLCTMMCNAGLGAKSGELGFDVTIKALADGANGSELKLTDVLVVDDELNSLYAGEYSFTVKYGEKNIDVSNEPATSKPDDESNESNESNESGLTSSVAESSTDETSEVPGDAGSPDSTLIIIIVVVLVLLAGGAAAAVLLLKKKKQ